MSKYLQYMTLLTNYDISLVYDELAVLLWMLLSGLVVLGLLILIFKMPGAIFGSLLLSGICSFIYAYAKSFGKADISAGYLAIALVLTILFFSFISYGLLEINTYFASGTINKWGTSIWFAVITLVPFGLFSAHYIPQAYNIINFINMDLDITYHNSYPIYIEEVKFINSKNKSESILGRLYGTSKKSVMLKHQDLEKMSLKEKLNAELMTMSSYSSKFSFQNPSQIPVGADGFIISWYSLIEDRYYSDTFPFPLEKFDSGIVRANAQRFIHHPTVHLIPNGSAVVYSSNMFNILNFHKIEFESIDDEKKSNFRKSFFKDVQFEGTTSELETELDFIKKENQLEDLKRQNTFLNWSLIIEGRTKESTISIIDSIYNRFTCKTNTVNRGPTPRVISFSSDKYKYEFYLDTYKALDLIEDHLSKEKDAKVILRVDFNESSPEGSKVFFNINEKDYLFSDWEVYSKKK